MTNKKTKKKTHKKTRLLVDGLLIVIALGVSTALVMGQSRITGLTTNANGSLVSNIQVDSTSLVTSSQRASNQHSDAKPALKPMPQKPIVESVPDHTFVDKDYVALADKVGWPGAAKLAEDRDKAAQDKIDRAKFESWMIDHEMVEFDEKAVGDYLDAQTKKMTDKERAKCEANKTKEQMCFVSQYSWEWFPLKGKEWEYQKQTLGTIQLNGMTTGGWVTGGTMVSSNGNIVFGGRVTGETKTSHTETPTANKYREDYVSPIPKFALMLMDEVRNSWKDAEFDVTSIDKKVDPFLRVRFSWGSVIITQWDEPGFGYK